jgi:predicted 2-oxoglutarate/Fe(II)-dependent dioxygenase YbiX
VALQKASYNILSKYLNGVVEIVKEIYDTDCFSESGPWIALAKKGGYMNMHCDGTFISNRDATTHFSSVYYINDDYEGGEFNMPVMGFKLKPKANSLLIFTHSSHEDMAHEVTPVISGDRFVSQGFFAVKK